jgi:uncharacterized protein
MGRIVVLVILVVVAVWLIRRALRRAGFSKDPKADIPKSKKAIEGELVACAHCGLNLPRGEALPAGNSLYCSEEHARNGPRA